MFLLVLSDTHGRYELAAEAFRRARPDAILFAGDGLRDLERLDPPCPVYAVRGNCDAALPIILGGREVLPKEEETAMLDGVRILLMHGHTYGVRSGPGRAILRAAQAGADLLVYGHTHRYGELRLLPDRPGAPPCLRKPLTVLNPGSLLGYPPSFATVALRDRQILCGAGSL